MSFITTQFGLCRLGAKVTITKFAVPGLISKLGKTVGTLVAIVIDPDCGAIALPGTTLGAAPANVRAVDGTNTPLLTTGAFPWADKEPV